MSRLPCLLGCPVTSRLYIGSTVLPVPLPRFGKSFVHVLVCLCFCTDSDRAFSNMRRSPSLLPKKTKGNDHPYNPTHSILCLNQCPKLQMWLTGRAIVLLLINLILLYSILDMGVSGFENFYIPTISSLLWCSTGLCPCSYPPIFFSPPSRLFVL